MGRDRRVPGSAGLHLAGGAVLLRPEEQVVVAMLGEAQQLARILAFSTIGQRLAAVGGLHQSCGRASVAVGGADGR